MTKQAGEKTIENQGAKPFSRFSIFAEPEFIVLLLISSLFYFLRLESHPLRGEETRRAMVAISMMESGDWIVPRQQGDPFFMSSRPPLQAWCIAAVAKLRGSFDMVTVRLPSVLALMTLLVVIYLYCRSFMGPSGAFAAGISYATMMQVLELARTGESDLLFTLFVSSSLLLWHYGFTHRWSPGLVWMVGYTAAALATMTKGPQAPVYFLASVGSYLILTHSWRFLFTRGHLAGIAIYAVIVGGWMLPFYWSVGLPGVRHLLTGDVSLYGSLRPAALVKHLTTFPLTVFFGCWFPWSFLLLAYLSPVFRRSLGPLRSPALFMFVCLAVTFPTVWMVPGARPRFLMSVYPCAAILVGIVVDRLVSSDLAEQIRRLAVRLPIGISIAVSGLGAVTLGLPIAGRIIGKDLPLAEPLPVAVALSLAAGILSAVIVSNRFVHSRQETMALLGSIALCVGGFYTVVIVDDLNRRSAHPETAISTALSNLPVDVSMVSIGPVHHAFAYHYYQMTHKMIPLAPPEWNAQWHGADSDYFCTSDGRFLTANQKPFSFEQLAIISCDRYKQAFPDMFVVIGKTTTLTAENVTDARE